MASSPEVRFSLNHVTCPRLDIGGLADLALSLGLNEVEIRNDVTGFPLADGTPGAEVGAVLKSKGTAVLTVNALQRFNEWNETRAAEAEGLAAEAAASGAAALVLCPVNEDGWRSGTGEREASLREALAALKPILDRHGLKGLVEALGFTISSLRYKRDAVEAVDAVGASDTFMLMHDTFHHALAADPDMYPHRTGLVHVSGVSKAEGLAFDDMRDCHRVLVDENDALDSVNQIAALQRGGYEGPISFECFASSVHTDVQIKDHLAQSMAFIREGVKAIV